MQLSGRIPGQKNKAMVFGSILIDCHRKFTNTQFVGELLSQNLPIIFILFIARLLYESCTDVAAVDRIYNLLPVVHVVIYLV